MGDRVAILRDGVLEQLGTPLELYERPVNVFVAGFIGSPAMNLVDATIEVESDTWFARFGDARLRFRIDRRERGPAWRRSPGVDVRLGVAPRTSGATARGRSSCAWSGPSRSARRRSRTSTPAASGR